MSPIVDVSFRQLRFANGNIANLVTSGFSDQAELLLDSLHVKSCDFILIPLGAAPELPSAADASLEQLSRSLLAFLGTLGRSVVIDTGTRNWITAPVQQRKVEKAPQVSFLGIAPSALVSYPGKSDQHAQQEPQRQLDSYHSDFILVESEERWGSQLPMLHAVVAALTSHAERVPVLALLAGQGLCMAEETLAAVRNGIPLAVVQGSGGLADEIARALTPGNAEPGSELVNDIIAEGQIAVLSQGNFSEELANLIGQERTPDEVLSQAWENFAVYDLNANHQQRQSDRITLSIIALGVIGAALAVLQRVLYGTSQVPFNLALDHLTPGIFWPWLLHYSLLVLPILLTILIAAAYKFKISSKWFVFRAGAEALKSEIYAYRSRALDYQRNSAQQLALRMAEIVKRTMQSDANGSHLREYDKTLGFPPYMDGAAGSDTGFGYLSPERYVEVRLEDQLRYFRKRTRKLDRQFQTLYWLTLLIGGITTLLGAISQQIWIAVTVPLATALGTLLTYRQTESNLLKFNQAAADLDNIKSWWRALPAAEKARQRNIDLLVDSTEKVLQTELDGWVQQMKNALADLEKRFDTTAQDAQAWKPNVEFKSYTAEERAEIAAAKRRAAATAVAPAAEAQRPVQAPPAERPTALEPEKLALAAESAPAASVEVTASVQPATTSVEATASVLPAAFNLEVKVNGLAAGTAAHNHKPVWDTKEITAEVLKDTIKNMGYKWFDDDLNIIGIRTTHYHDNKFEDRLFCCWKQPACPTGYTPTQKQQFLVDWAYKGKNGAPIHADGVEGDNTRFALSQLAFDADKERVLHWAITTRPGTKSLLDKDILKKGGCAVVVPKQYKDAYELGYHKQAKLGTTHPALVQRGELEIYRDADMNLTANEAGKKYRGENFGINIHHAGDNSQVVEDWSAGCQVFKGKTDHADFLRICQHFGSFHNHKRFAYTLLHEADLVS